MLCIWKHSMTSGNNRPVKDIKHDLHAILSWLHKWDYIADQTGPHTTTHDYREPHMTTENTRPRLITTTDWSHWMNLMPRLTFCHASCGWGDSAGYHGDKDVVHVVHLLGSIPDDLCCQCGQRRARGQRYGDGGSSCWGGLVRVGVDLAAG